MLPTLLLGQASFASGWMLAWAAAAAIPILLHLLNRRSLRRQPWAAMRLLQEVIEQQSRRVRLEQLILLVLRVAIPVLLALALARPFLANQPTSQASESQRQSRLWIVAVDVSYSMGYQDDGRTLLQLAKQEVESLLDDALLGDAFVLLALADPSDAIIADPTFNKSAMLTQVQRLKLRDTGCNLVSLLPLIQATIERSKGSFDEPMEVAVTILSDMGRDAWQSAVSGPVRNQLAEMIGDHRVSVLDLSPNQPQNLAITAAKPSTRRLAQGDMVNVDVTVENFSNQDYDRLPVQLQLDGQTIASEYVQLPVGGRANVSIAANLIQQGPAVLTAVLPTDSLVADNTRHVVVEVAEQDRLLLVEPYPEAAKSLRLALSPADRNQAFTTTRQLTQISPFELGAIDLHEWDVVILHDPIGIDPQLAERLRDFVRTGGGAILMFGSGAMGPEWSRDDSPVAQLLGFSLDQPSELGDWMVDPLEYASPLVRPFEGFPDSGLVSTPIFLYWKIHPVASGAELSIDLGLQNGDPLILRHRLGDGWVASWLSAPQETQNIRNADPIWNAFPAWPSFLPLVQLLVQEVLSEPDETVSVMAGTPLSGQVRSELQPAKVTVQRPDGQEDEIVAESTDILGIKAWLYRRTLQSGVYVVSCDGNDRKVRAVNIDPIEGSMEAVTLQQLPAGISSGGDGQRATASGDSSQSSDLLGRWILIALGATLLAESVVAWVLGRRGL